MWDDAIYWADYFFGCAMRRGQPTAVWRLLGLQRVYEFGVIGDVRVSGLLSEHGQLLNGKHGFINTCLPLKGTERFEVEIEGVKGVKSIHSKNLTFLSIYFKGGITTWVQYGKSIF